VDDDESLEGDDGEPGKTQQWMPMRRGVRGFTSSAAVLGCHRRRITGGVDEKRDGLASGGSSRGR